MYNIQNNRFYYDKDSIIYFMFTFVFARFHIKRYKFHLNKISTKRAATFFQKENYVMFYVNEIHAVLQEM